MTETLGDESSQRAPRGGAGRWRRRAAGLRARRRLPVWWPAVLCALLGMAGGAAYGLLATPQYAATSYVVVVPTGRADSAVALGFAQAYGRVSTEGVVLARAQAEAGVDSGTLRSGIRSATSPDAPMIEITGAATRADRAATRANAVARALAGYGNEATAKTGVELSLLSEAMPPTAPVTAGMPLSLAVGGCAGVLVGCLVLLVRPSGRRPSAPEPASVAPGAAPSVATQPGDGGVDAGAAVAAAAAAGDEGADSSGSAPVGRGRATGAKSGAKSRARPGAKAGRTPAQGGRRDRAGTR
ncbi:hypothetical protein PJ985_01780 [Streptomyces sp. ACA25]|uniref:hypothetical protein n=1 Tax=Streptomyces sp. ACA25 TaxID=3022596 RepID=UPI002307D4B2|nr:hypothetical protein [Streptomyces sp. ACA25]MDB1086302.1 hypothetical protein [Streptomyces sp. ACA25]